MDARETVLNLLDNISERKLNLFIEEKIISLDALSVNLSIKVFILDNSESYCVYSLDTSISKYTYNSTKLYKEVSDKIYNDVWENVLKYLTSYNKEFSIKYFLKKLYSKSTRNKDIDDIVTETFIKDESADLAYISLKFDKEDIEKCLEFNGFRQECYYTDVNISSTIYSNKKMDIKYVIELRKSKSKNNMWVLIKNYNYRAYGMYRLGEV